MPSTKSCTLPSAATTAIRLVQPVTVLKNSQLTIAYTTTPSDTSAKNTPARLARISGRIENPVIASSAKRIILG